MLTTKIHTRPFTYNLFRKSAALGIIDIQRGFTGFPSLDTGNPLYTSKLWVDIDCPDFRNYIFGYPKMLNERPIHPYNALYICSQANRQIERVISAHCLGDHFHWLVSVSENDNTPQPLDKWTNSPFIGQQDGNCKDFHIDPLLGRSICHAPLPKINPIAHPISYPTHIPFIPSESTLPFLNYSNFNILPWKSKVKIMGEVKVWSHNVRLWV